MCRLHHFLKSDMVLNYFVLVLFYFCHTISLCNIVRFINFAQSKTFTLLLYIIIILKSCYYSGIYGAMFLKVQRYLDFRLERKMTQKI